MVRWWAALLLLAVSAVPLHAADAPLQLVQTIRLDVKGRIDHFAIDEAKGRLFVAALGNHSVEVIDLAKGAPLRSVRGFGKPQGVAYSAEHDRLYVADGDRGTVTALNGTNFGPAERVEKLADADNLRLDPAGQRLFVGYGEGAIRALDARALAPLGEVRLPAHPEGFAVADDGKRIFVNVPGAAIVGAIDLDRGELAQRWGAGEVPANFPLAFDAGSGRVFVATRRPAAVRVFDANGGGRSVAQVPIDGDADDLFFDRDTGNLYVVCGAGYIDVLHADGGDQFRVVARVPTRAGARTGLFVPAWRRLYVAVPGSLDASAEVRVFDAAPGGRR